MIDQEKPVIETEEDYREVQGELTQKKRPAKVLRIMMNALESYRQARKFGWSRPWNKYDLLNFQSFQLDWQRDAIFIDYARALLAAEADEMPAPARAFCDELLADSDHLMGFIFIHDFTENGTRYEGGTLSLGRVYSNGRRYRDRLDIILEAPVENNSSRGLSRLRLFVDPYDPARKEPLWSTCKSSGATDPSRTLFDALTRASWEWAGDTERMWDHWTSAYIDYFGERTAGITGSYFHVPGHPEARIATSAAASGSGQERVARTV